MCAKKSHRNTSQTLFSYTLVQEEPNPNALTQKTLKEKEKLRFSERENDIYVFIQQKNKINLRRLNNDVAQNQTKQGSHAGFNFQT